MPLRKIKRAVKKVTKPIAKVLDKIIPNEIKPFLPYAAAFTPFMLPASFGIGSLSPMVSRALAAGAANLGSQLAQEGSEGDFSATSLALASGIGALSAPGAGDTLRGGIAKTTGREAGIMAQSGVTPAGGIGEGFLQGAENIGREALAGSADFLSVKPGSGGIGDILRPGGTKVGFNMPTAKALSVPFTQGTTDLAMATARKALKDYEDELAAYEAETGEAQFASDEARRTAIRAAMTAGQHSEDVISETLALLGLKDGGVVKMKDGGIMDLGGKEMDLRGGGFVPIGKKERADDVPARLSKNEFVMTADAVRAAGGGNINEGAKRMYETMNRLEARA